MTRSTDTTIKIAFEQEDMTPEQIAEDLGFEVESIKAKLMQISAKYRRACSKESENSNHLNFTDDQLERINQVIYETALAAEHPDGSPDFKTRLNAAIYIRDDKKGRKEVRQTLQNSNTFNILNFNEELVKARSLTQEARKVIDVKSSS